MNVSSQQDNGRAHVTTLGSACHYKAAAERGHTRTFVGTYDFDLVHSVSTVSETTKAILNGRVRHDNIA